MGEIEIRIVGPGKTRGYPYPVCKKKVYSLGTVPIYLFIYFSFFFSFLFHIFSLKLLILWDQNI